MKTTNTAIMMAAMATGSTSFERKMNAQGYDLVSGNNTQTLKVEKADLMAAVRNYGIKLRDADIKNISEFFRYRNTDGMKVVIDTEDSITITIINVKQCTEICIYEDANGEPYHQMEIQFGWDKAKYNATKKLIMKEAIKFGFVVSDKTAFMTAFYRVAHNRTLLDCARIAQLCDTYNISTNGVWEPSCENATTAYYRHGKYAERALGYAIEFASLPEVAAYDTYISGQHVSDTVNMVLKMMPRRWVHQAKHAQIKAFLRNACALGLYYPKNKSTNRILSMSKEALIINRAKFSYIIIEGRTLTEVIEERFSREIRALQRKEAWQKMHGRIPKNHILSLVNPTKDFKVFQQALKLIPTPMWETRHEYYGIVSLLRCGLNTATIKMVVDGGMLHLVPQIKEDIDFNGATASFAERAITELGAGVIKKVIALITLKDELGISDKAFKECDIQILLDKAIDLGFDFNPECRDFAIEYATHNSGGYCEHYEEQYLQKKTAEAIPYAEVTMGEYRMYKLHAYDPRALFLGDYTDCCQGIGGAGESCAWHGWQNPNGAFFVITKNDKIIAQSWAWKADYEGESYVVFDNIERLSGHSENEVIVDLYKAIASKIVGKFGIVGFQIGLGYNDIKGIEEFKSVKNKWIGRLPSPKGIYSDASERVWLLKPAKTGVDTDGDYKAKGIDDDGDRSI